MNRVRQAGKLVLKKPGKEYNGFMADDLKKLRTYEGDVAEAIRRENESIASIATAESIKRNMEESGVLSMNARSAQGSGRSQKVLLFFSLLFVVGGVASAGYLYYQSQSLKEEITIVANITPSLITPQSKTDIRFTPDLNETTIFEQYQKKLRQLPESGLEEIVITKIVRANGLTEESRRLTAKEFFALNRTPVPEIILRSLDDRFMIGGIDGTPFIVLKTKLYENILSGMRRWEELAIDDLGPLLNLPENEVGRNQAFFEDAVFKNRDLRVLKDSGGTPLLAYHFFDKETLLISQNEEAIGVLIEKILSSQNIKIKGI